MSARVSLLGFSNVLRVIHELIGTSQAIPISGWMKFARFGMKPTSIPVMVNSAQISESHEITKVISLKDAHKNSRPQFSRAKEKYENQHKR